MSGAAFLWTMLGVICAVLLPFLANLIKREFPQTQAIGMPPWVKRYLLLGVFSAVVAVISVMLWANQHPGETLDTSTAFLLGFGWESAIEKFGRPKP